jgi:ech hydrogenase subunit F
MFSNLMKYPIIAANLFRAPVTVRYPAETLAPVAGSRGSIRFDPTTCNHCTLCAKRCPADAIMVNRATGEWHIDPMRCVLCGACVEACTKKSVTMSGERSPPVCKAQSQMP